MALQGMAYYLAQRHEMLGDLRPALDAYLRAMSLAGSTNEWDFRWGAYVYANLMVDASVKSGASLVNVLPDACRRELTDNPAGLYADTYHPGPIGNELIAMRLADHLTAISRHHAVTSGVRRLP
jgi:hypothetical protein